MLSSDLHARFYSTFAVTQSRRAASSVPSLSVFSLLLYAELRVSRRACYTNRAKDSVVQGVIAKAANSYAATICNEKQIFQTSADAVVTALVRAVTLYWQRAAWHYRAENVKKNISNYDTTPEPTGQDCVLAIYVRQEFRWQADFFALSYYGSD